MAVHRHLNGGVEHIQSGADPFLGRSSSYDGAGSWADVLAGTADAGADIGFGHGSQ